MTELHKLSYFEHVDYNDRTGTYYATFDWESSTDLTTAIVEGIAAVSGQEVTSLPPLANVVDPDTLARAFKAQRQNVSESGNGCIVFEFAGYELTLYWDGTLIFDPLDEESGEQGGARDPRHESQKWL